MSKIKIPYEDDNENLPSPTKELRDVPFSRVSKTIVKLSLPLVFLNIDEKLSTPTRHRPDIFNVDESPLSASSRSHGSQEFGSSPILRDKKLENSAKKGNTSKLNEKYAMMQQKMTQMAQDNETPLASKAETPTAPKRRYTRILDDESGANPFYIPSSTQKDTRGNLLFKQPEGNKGEEIGQGNASEQEFSFRRTVIESLECRQIQTLSNEGGPSNFPPGIFSHESTMSRPQNVSTPDFRRHGSTFQPETPRWKSAPRLKTSHASPFVTPPHRRQQKSFPNTMRKHATRFTSVWPPKLLSSSSLTEDQDDEEKLDELLGPAPVSPSPRVPRKRTYSEIDHISNLTNDCEICDDEEEPDSPKRTYTNIYTRQLTQQNLSFDDAANPPLVIDDELFYDSNEFLNLANL
ncbi:5219_t:CDS:2 [Dentiscutata erythropus]|uniref:5219_t:CDS:1 n=1 Tax=Dentiscutata erythropus TaxID=1348616 RepID=A0A9N9NY80_9GLOM|nr:5219_t:CDS:2 [Dentiscutata erythropus]